jgi:hypothetical protein
MKMSHKITVCIFSFLALNFLCKSLTDDFSTNYLIHPAPKESKWNTGTPPPELEPLLDQKYTYLAKGKQAYVFLSEDKTHVLKLFKPLAPFINLPLFGKNFHIGLAKIPFVKALTIDPKSPGYLKTRDMEFQSYINSFFLLPEETKLEYLHLAETDCLKKKLKVYDKIGVLHTIDLDSSSFLIQKKTDLLYPTLSKLLKNKETEQAKVLLKNFVEFYFQLIEKDIFNPTTLEKNLGCSSDLKPVQIDVGRVLRPQDLKLADLEVPLTQIYKSTSHMKKWLKSRSPELYVYLKQIEEELLQANSSP